MNVFVTNASLGLGLTDQVLQIVLKADRVFEETHGDVVISITVLQPREKRATEQKTQIQNYTLLLIIQEECLTITAHKAP